MVLDARSSKHNAARSFIRMKLLRAILFVMTTVASAHAATVTHAPFGTLPDGARADVYTLKSLEVEARVTTYGARIVGIKTKDRDGKIADIVFGFNSAADYTQGKNAYFGTVPGRYANRIAKGKFTLEGQPHQITINDGPNMLHGGVEGFDRRNWSAKEIPNGVEFTLVSPDGDQGFPGTLTAHVRYTLIGNKLHIEYSATTDKPTVVNLTNHAYFNLSGEGSPSILDDLVTLDADKYTPVDATLIPTGELAPVAGTPFDFTKPTRIGERIGADHEQLKRGGGYDHNWVVRGKTGDLRPAAKVVDPTSGRVLTVLTTEPGIQFYTGNFLDGSLVGKSGAKYVKRSGFCLETQHFPDSPNHPNFPSTELKPGQTYHSTTEFIFTAEK
jgi:aldose 1-epimerase